LLPIVPQKGADTKTENVRLRRQEKWAGSKLVLALGVEELVGAVVIGFRHERPGRGGSNRHVRHSGVLIEGLLGCVNVPINLCDFFLH
jgi:hypothetical protein